jgi:hypothetical protein
MNATKYITTPTIILIGIIAVRGCFLHCESEAGEARKHALTVIYMDRQAYLILKYVYETTNSPQSLDEIQEYYDRVRPDLFADIMNIRDRWENVITWSLNREKQTMTGISLGRDGQPGGKGLEADIKMVIDVSTNILRYAKDYRKALLPESENIRGLERGNAPAQSQPSVIAQPVDEKVNE